MEEQDTLVTLIDEDNGREVDFDLLLTFSYEGKRYAALQPLDDVEGVAEDEIRSEEKSLRVRSLVLSGLEQ